MGKPPPRALRLPARPPLVARRPHRLHMRARAVGRLPSWLAGCVRVCGQRVSVMLLYKARTRGVHHTALVATHETKSGL